MKEIKIGNQIWMAENLDIDTFGNGDPIPQVYNQKEWEFACNHKEPACLYYGPNFKHRGKIYNWYALNDPRGLFLDGWKVPSATDWEELIHFVGGKSIAGQKLKSTSAEWEEFGGEDEFGLCINPGGFITESGLGEFRWYVHFWTSTEGEGCEKDYAISYVFDGCSNESSTNFSPKSWGKYCRLIRE
jgi:uncharacterized protein (TIGR02145 family)